MPDVESLVAPAFTAVLTALGVYVGMSNQLAILKVELQNLTKQVEKHNSVVERTYRLETNDATMWQRFDELKARIDRLEEQHVGGTD